MKVCQNMLRLLPWPLSTPLGKKDMIRHTFTKINKLKVHRQPSNPRSRIPTNLILSPLQLLMPRQIPPLRGVLSNLPIKVWWPSCANSTISIFFLSKILWLRHQTRNSFLSIPLSHKTLLSPWTKFCIPKFLLLLSGFPRLHSHTCFFFNKFNFSKKRYFIIFVSYIECKEFDLYSMWI